MSHNVKKVGGQSPNANGEITFSISNLSDVSLSSLSNNDVLKYSSGSWQNSPASSLPATIQIIYIGEGASNAYSNSGLTTIGSNDEFRLYDASPVNTITSATITKEGSTDWIKFITLPAGEYQIIAQVRVEFTASGYFVYRIVSDPTNTKTDLTPYAVIGENSNGYANGVSQTLQGYLNLTSSTDIGLNVHAVSNVDTVANQGNTPSEFSYLFIEKLG